MIDYISQSTWFEYQSVRQCVFKEGCCTANQKTKECRPTQIEIEDNNKQKEITPQKQEIQEYKYATTWRIYKTK